MAAIMLPTTEEISNLIKEVNPTGENEPDILSKLEEEMAVDSAEADPISQKLANIVQ